MGAIRSVVKLSRWAAKADEVCAAAWCAMQDPDSVLNINNGDVAAAAAAAARQDDNSSDRSVMACLDNIIDPTNTDDDSEYVIFDHVTRRE